MQLQSTAGPRPGLPRREPQSPAYLQWHLAQAGHDLWDGKWWQASACVWAGCALPLAARAMPTCCAQPRTQGAVAVPRLAKHQASGMSDKHAGRQNLLGKALEIAATTPSGLQGYSASTQSHSPTRQNPPNRPASACASTNLLVQGALGMRRVVQRLKPRNAPLQQTTGRKQPTVSPAVFLFNLGGSEVGAAISSQQCADACW